MAEFVHCEMAIYLEIAGIEMFFVVLTNIYSYKKSRGPKHTLQNNLRFGFKKLHNLNNHYARKS